MQEPIQKYFRVGTISSVSFPQTDPICVLKALAADEFFDFVEFDHVANKADIQKIKKYLRQGHISASYSAHWVVLGQKQNPNDLDEAGRKHAEGCLLTALEEAYSLGAECFTFLAGPASEGKKAEGLAQLEKTVLAICQRADDLSIQVELELFDYDLDKCSLLGPAPLAAEFAAKIRQKVSNFGLMADLSHFPATREDSQFVLRTIRPFLTHLHLGNIVVEKGKASYGDLHPRFGFPDSEHDVPDVVEFLRCLREESFFNAEKPYPLTFEVRPQAGETPEIVLVNAKRTLRRAWSILED